MKAERAWCAFCGVRRVRNAHNRFCSRECAVYGRSYVMNRANLQKALTVRRQRYLERLRQRIRSARSPAVLWRLAYNRGFQACWQGWQRRVQRGEVIVLKDRRRIDMEAA